MEEKILYLHNENYLFMYAKYIGEWLAIKDCKNASEEEKNCYFKRLTFNTSLSEFIDVKELREVDDIQYCFNELTTHKENGCVTHVNKIKIKYKSGPLSQIEESGKLTKPARK